MVESQAQIPTAPGKRSRLGWWIVSGAAVVIGAGMIFSPHGPHRMPMTRENVLTELRQLGLALFDFDSDYGSFPSADTLAAIQANTGTRVAKPENPLSQLEAGGIVPDLDPLLVVPRGAEGNWLYFPGMSATGSGPRIVMITPKIDGRRMALRIDNSAAALSEEEIDILIARADPPPVSIPPSGYR